MNNTSENTAASCCNSDAALEINKILGFTTVELVEDKGPLLRIIDQTLLPGELKYLELDTPASIYDAIYKLKVRGAPAIGVAAGYALYVLAAKAAAEIPELNNDIASPEGFLEKIDETARYLISSRPTAVNLSWAVNRVKAAAQKRLLELDCRQFVSCQAAASETAEPGFRPSDASGASDSESCPACTSQITKSPQDTENIKPQSCETKSIESQSFKLQNNNLIESKLKRSEEEGSDSQTFKQQSCEAEISESQTFRLQSTEIIQSILDAMKQEALDIHNEDIEMCRRIGEYGLELLKPGMGILTHCNAGALATSGIGTALAPVYTGLAKGYNFKVFADETRPLLQGARLTSWELNRAGADVTLICDNMASMMMKQGKIQAVITGADRIAANGDTANKIGTSGVAILAKEYGIPFYVAAPYSTFDMSCKTGADIKIEQRPGDEIYRAWYEKPMAPEGIKTVNPAFDVTDHKYITAFITDKGVQYVKK